MSYISRSGEEVASIPSGFIKCDKDASVEAAFVVLVCEEGVNGNLLGEEIFSEEPTEGQIKYCLSKYPSPEQNDTYAEVSKVYRLVY